MAICAVFGCDSNNTKKLKRNAGGISFKMFRFPRNERLAKIWLAICKRKDKINFRTSYICSKHFSKDQHARNLRHELLGYSPKCGRRLREDAIPDQNLPEKADDFVFQAVPAIGEEMITETPPEPVIENSLASLVIEFLEDGTECGSQTIKKDENYRIENIPDCEVQEVFLEDQHTNAEDITSCDEQKARLQEMNPTQNDTSDCEIVPVYQEVNNSRIQNKIPTRSSAELIRSLRVEIDLLKSEMDRILEENAALKASNKSLAQENAELIEENNMVAKIFTPKQREKMRKAGKRLQWTVEDISRAVALYYNGPQAYNFLLKQGYPLPAMITLKKWLTKTP